VKFAAFSVATASLFALGCDGSGGGSSSESVEAARSRGILIAEYSVPDNAKLGPYQLVEVWIEDGRRLVVRLKGPHVDDEPRVNVRGLTDRDYLSIWSERNGPPYEVWFAPDPIPDTLFLERESKSIELHRRM